MTYKTKIIAEAGVNHNGSIELAIDMIKAASNSGADFIKFQTFFADKIATTLAPKAKYQTSSACDQASAHDMLRSLELPLESFKILYEECKRQKIGFLSTAFDIESLDYLINIGMKIIKIPSGEITNLPFLEYIGSRNMPTILSTGMADLVEIKEAIKILTNSGLELSSLSLLQCTSEYPTPFKSTNLKVINALKKLGHQVGFSDHTLGIEAAIAAVTLGADIIEKHFTLDKSFEGPDHKASLDVSELHAMISAIRNIEKALGSEVKKPSKIEIETRDVVRRSLVAKQTILKGEKFSKENITAKRPGKGLSPMHIYKVLGKKAKQDFKPDDLIVL